jgi:transposase
MHRYELSNQRWAKIAPFFPHRTHHGNVGHPFNAPRPAVNGILWVLHTGAPWRDLPERYGPWATVFGRFNEWRKDGTWNRIVTALLDELDDQGQIDHDLWCIDGSVVRASRSAAGAEKKTERSEPTGWSKAGASRGAAGSCAGSLTRRLWHEGSLGLRQQGLRLGPSGDGWPSPREQGIRGHPGTAAVA